MKLYRRMVKPVIMFPDSHYRQCYRIIPDEGWYPEEDTLTLKEKYKHLENTFEHIVFDERYEVQEPRVLTADEMEDAGRNGDPVYVETACGGRFWALAIPGVELLDDKPFNYPGDMRFNVREADGDIHDGDFYGMTTLDGKAHPLAWRAWTNKPTDEQMENTPWEN